MTLSEIEAELEKVGDEASWDWDSDGTFLKSFLREKLLSILDEVVMEEKEEGQTEKCKDVMAMNYLIGRNKGWNECRAELLSRIENIKK